MTNDKTEKDKKTVRAHIWSPLNKGEAILEISIGATVEELLETLSKIWGAQFKPQRGFATNGGYIAGWCVLCKSTTGIFFPLGIDDRIPTGPFDDETCHSLRRTDWFHQTLNRIRRRHYWENRDEEKDAFIKENDFRESHTNIKKSAYKGILPYGYHGFHDQELQALLSGPEPKEEVDVRLALIIAVSGT
jgi:hypothetical protein